MTASLASSKGILARRARGARSQVLSTSQQITAVFSHPTLYRVASVIDHRQPVGRPALHPVWALLGFGVLARVFRSGARTEAELRAPGVWDQILATVEQVRAAHPDLDIPPARADRPPEWSSWKHVRNRYLTAPETLEAMRDEFTFTALELANEFGLLVANGPGSLSNPDPSRVVYGDGTVIRPMYRPPRAKREVNKKTGEVTITYLDDRDQPITQPLRRFDPDAAEYHGHAGSVHGQNYVGLYARGPRPHQRVVLAVDRVPRPGQEAETATALFRHIHPAIGAGAQAFVYDGAIRGVHIDQIMRECGVLVINKVHGAASGSRTKERWFILGTWEHDTAHGQCRHQLAAVDGAVHEVAMTEDGTPALIHRLERKQVKRPRRSTGHYHFNVAYEVPCPSGSFLAWVTPHAAPEDTDHRRADAVRVIAAGEPLFATLYGLRNDSESFNSQLKRTLLVDRAMSKGGQRQLLDVLCFAILHNACNAWRAATYQGPALAPSLTNAAG